MNTTTIIGYLAAALTTISGLPQLVKIMKTKSTHDVSLWYFVILTIGVGLWLVYGILVHLWPIIFANVLTFIIVGCILGCKIRYK